MASSTQGLPGASGVVPLTSAQIATGLLDSDDYRLASNQFTFSIPTSGSAWPGYAARSEPTTGYVALNSQQATQFVAGVNLWDSYLAPNFTQVSDSTPGFVRIAFTRAGEDDGYAYAYTGYGQGPQGASVGDIWLNTYYVTPSQTTFTPGDYDWLAMLHELGHTMGLKHPFEAPTLPTDYDTTRYTIMSYTQYSDNLLVAFTRAGSSISTASDFVYPTTPMVLDIAALQGIYGSGTANAGDTRYSFDDWVTTGIMRTIDDSSGTDTIDLTGMARGSVVDLHPGAYSTIGYWSTNDQADYWIAQYGAGYASFIRDQYGSDSYTGHDNLGISFSTTIEQVNGSQGGDVIIGNAADNVLLGQGGDDVIFGDAGNDTLDGGVGIDQLTGGAGVDRFQATSANFDGDTITDLAVGEVIVVADGFLAGFGYTMIGDRLQLNSNSSIILSGLNAGANFAISADSGGGVDLQLISVGPQPVIAPEIAHDFNGDRHSDIFWQNVNGAVSAWSSVGGGNADILHQATFNGAVDTSWTAVDSFDLNGDASADIVWRNQNGSLAVWTSANGNFDQSAYYHGPIGGTWRVAGAGDLNGDGRGDLIWQDDSSAISTWQSTGAGFQENTYYHGSVGASWKVEGVGDFNGDGRQDILWRNTDGGVSVWNSTGAGFQEGSFYQPGVPTSWHIDGVGDFNGDGRDDILWRNDDGTLTTWQSDGAGSFAEGLRTASAPTAWNIEQTGDFNADGLADILWRNVSGAISIWHASGDGWLQNTYFDGSVPTSWDISAHQFPL